MKRALPLIALLLGACSDGPSLVVDVVTDYRAGDELTRITAHASRGDDADGSLDVDASDRDRVWHGVRLLSLDSLAEGTISVDIALFHGEDAFANRRVDLTLRGDSAITVVMSRRCDGVRCDGQVCHGEACVAATCSSLDRDACGEPECRRDSDCEGSVECAATRCVEGVCLERLDDSLCEGGSCEAGLGCTGPIDGGLDAGSDAEVDAAMDGTVDAPDAIVDAPDARDAIVVCMEPCDDGDPCTEGDACNDAGVCVGEPMNCTSHDSSCRVGVCVDGSCERMPRPDGTSCNSDSNQRCCNGSCTNIASSSGNCGGCGIECLSGTSCGFGRCGCKGSERACLPGYACNVFNACTCEDATACAPGQTCDDVFGGPLCNYP